MCDALLCHAKGTSWVTRQVDVREGNHLQTCGSCADLAKGHQAPYRDNALSKARFEFRWEDQFNLY